MSLIRPFRGLRPAPEYIRAVLAPPYDVLSTEEARACAGDSPWNFMHVSRPEVDLPVDTNAAAPAVYAKGRENFLRMIDEGILRYDPKPCYYVYRLFMGAHQQTGLVAVASVAAYQAKRICKHENTQPHKVDDRARHIDTLNAQTGPVALIYRHASKLDSLVQAAAHDAPEVSVADDNGVRHSMWIVRDRAQVDALTAAFGSLDALYIADGHHRSAAAARVATERRVAYPDHSGDEAYDYFLSVIFPDDQMRILEYNRVVKDLGGLARDVFLRKLQSSFAVEVTAKAVRPARTGEFGMYLPGQWYRLTIKGHRVPQNPVGRLDISLLGENLMRPILGITDPRGDTRIDFVGGIRGVRELERRVDSGDMAVAFSLYPTSLANLMDVADAGLVLPPKSTWFEPKLADGLVSHVLG